MAGLPLPAFTLSALCAPPAREPLPLFLRFFPSSLVPALSALVLPDVFEDFFPLTTSQLSCPTSRPSPVVRSIALDVARASVPFDAWISSASFASVDVPFAPSLARACDMISQFPRARTPPDGRAGPRSRRSRCARACPRATLGARDATLETISYAAFVRVRARSRASPPASGTRVTRRGLVGRATPTAGAEIAPAPEPEIAPGRRDREGTPKRTDEMLNTRGED